MGNSCCGGSSSTQHFTHTERYSGSNSDITIEPTDATSILSFTIKKDNIGNGDSPSVGGIVDPALGLCHTWDMSITADVDSDGRGSVSGGILTLTGGTPKTNDVNEEYLITLQYEVA